MLKGMRTSTYYGNSVKMDRTLTRTSIPIKIGKPVWKVVSSVKKYFQTWMYLMIPVCLNAYDRGMTFMVRNHTVNILKAVIYQGNVLALYMDKPPGFKYKFGSYMLVKCPEISSSEWHPFSIISAPGDSYLSVLIRTPSGECAWTTAFQEIFAKACKPPVNQIGNVRAVNNSDLQPTNYPRIIIKGPYGAQAQNYKKYDILLLIGLDSGAPLFISILKDLLYNLEITSTQDIMSRNGPQKAYFFWVTSEQGSFEWFKGVIDDIAEYDSDNMIEIHNFLTTVYEEGDARSAFIEMVQSLQHARSGLDVISRTRIRTQFAMPDWMMVFAQLAVAHESQNIGVFYCGSRRQMKPLRKFCQDLSHNTNTHFHFHFNKEN